MSVVVWDGKRIAADQQAALVDMRVRMEKVYRAKDGAVLAFTGNAALGLLLCAWYDAGARIEDWPSFQSTDDWCRLIVAKTGACAHYEAQPIPIPVLDHFAAWGSGRDFAIGALAAGADALAAVEIASRFNVHCGMGATAMEPLI